MKTSTAVGVGLVVVAAGAAAYFLIPRKVAFTAGGAAAKPPPNAVDQARGYVDSISGAVASGNQLFGQLQQFGGNLSTLFGGGKPPAGAGIAQGTSDSPPNMGAFNPYSGVAQA